jgi:hypothetical protein
MRSSAVISYVPKPVREKLQKKAADLCLPLSRYVSRLLEGSCDFENGEDNVPEITREELEERLKSADDPKNCTFFATKESLMNHIDEVAARALRN